jgi:hypothetical protein
VANFTTGQDLVKSTLQRTGELDDGTSPLNARALEYLNGFYQQILSGGSVFKVDLGEPWYWAKQQYSSILTLLPAYTTGTVSVTQDSTSATLSVASASSLAGYYLKIDNRPEYFRIAAHTAATTALTLDSGYTDVTGAGLGFKAILVDYTLSAGMQRLLEPMVVYRLSSNDQSGRIYGLDLKRFRDDYPLGSIEGGIPTQFATLYEIDGTLTVRFNRYPNQKTRVEYDYIPIPAALADSSGSIPLVPREHRQVLAFGATYYLMLDKNDSRADVYLRLAQAGLQAMLTANRKEQIHQAKQFGRIVTRPEQENRTVRTAWPE